MAAKTVKTTKMASVSAQKSGIAFDNKSFAKTVEDVLPPLVKIIKPMLTKAFKAAESAR